MSMKHESFTLTMGHMGNVDGMAQAESAASFSQVSGVPASEHPYWYVLIHSAMKPESLSHDSCVLLAFPGHNNSGI